MHFTVRFTRGAQADLRELHSYISKNDSLENADYVAKEIVRTALTLRESPNRGAHPRELLRLGNRNYRQILFKPFRIVYRLRSKTVFIALIADGRREMASLLLRRLGAN